MWWLESGDTYDDIQFPVNSGVERARLSCAWWVGEKCILPTKSDSFPISIFPLIHLYKIGCGSPVGHLLEQLTNPIQSIFHVAPLTSKELNGLRLLNPLKKGKGEEKRGWLVNITLHGIDSGSFTSLLLVYPLSTSTFYRYLVFSQERHTPLFICLW